MTARPLVLVALVFLMGCRCSNAPASTVGPPFDGAVDALPDVYQGLPPRGGVPALARATKVMERVGDALGYGHRPADSLRAHAEAPWAKRLVLFLDHGGTEQLGAAWMDLSDTIVRLPGVAPEVKVQIRQAQARVDDLKSDSPPESDLRRRLLAEIAWTMVLVDSNATDAGTSSPKR